MTHRISVPVVALAGLLHGVAANAQLDPERFTPVGAERAGNAEGTIPEWTGGLTPLQWPKGFKSGRHYLDPFPDDRPLIVITADNYREHADKLSPGQSAMFERNPTYRMPVYPTRRSVAYPDEIYAATEANIGRARLAGANSIEGARIGFPFPMPRSGMEVLWNHRLRYRGDAVYWNNWQSVVLPNGLERRINIEEWSIFQYARLTPLPNQRTDASLHYTVYRASPVRCGQIVWLWHEGLNPVQKARNGWTYCGNFKPFRIPPVGHDDFSIGSEQLRYFDMLDMFTGEFDRYTFKLIGKKELYIPYNAYRLNDGQLTHDQLLTRRHFNQQQTRYELHRVWIVEATLRSGETHNIGKRVFHVDEDSWAIAIVDLYATDGRLERLQEGHLTFLYDARVVEPMPQLVYDLKDGRYFATRLISETAPPRFDAPELRIGNFQPARITSWHTQ